ncbi:Protein of unknown function [Pyronema omphalodes CBS 100304]|uniref:BZIP domain-containing protein n=1 Tax=Pyronema omphalodes (strain CBS 100304) TaxID=1076935 RepID=U4LGA7_PYROM|nr:Protein of unknown function [Pyronema omphalodes CBS 100304]
MFCESLPPSRTTQPSQPIGTPFLSARTYSNQYDDHLNAATFDLDNTTFDDNYLFGSDFTLFDNVELNKSLVTPDTTVQSFDSFLALTQAEDFLDLSELLDNSPTSSTISPITQAPSPVASGSEGHSPLSFAECYNENPGLTPVSSTTTTPPTQLLLTPTDTNAPIHLFPPLGQSSLSFSVTNTPNSTVSTTSSRTKRKASEIEESPRPKELVDTTVLSDDDEKEVRRKRNTAAARRYRQKKQDRMTELEEELAEERKQKDMWRQEAQRYKMEAEKWKAMAEFMQQQQAMK